MPLLAILLLICCVPARAQDERVVFPERNIVIEKGFSEIQKQTDYLISVGHNDFDVTRKVRLTQNNLTVVVALRQLLAGSKKKFLVQGRHILIVPDVREAPAVKPEIKVIAEEQDQLPKINHPMPVDVDSLEKALRARKVEVMAEIPPEPALNSTAYYKQRGMSGGPEYVSSMPRIALRTNLLYDIAALTPNLGIEIGLARRSTLLVSGSYNGWRQNAKSDKKKLNHWIAEAEYRYWFCERFNGHFLGFHAYYGYYNIAGYEIPMVLEKNSDQYRYRGDVFGAGLSYGYQIMLGKNWNLELNAGFGFGIMNYDKYDCPRCGEVIDNNISKTFFAPTKLGISLVYIIK